MLHMLEALRRRTQEDDGQAGADDGQTMTEYSVVLSVITIACLGAIALLGGSVIAAISRVAGIIP